MARQSPPNNTQNVFSQPRGAPINGTPTAGRGVGGGALRPVVARLSHEQLNEFSKAAWLSCCSEGQTRMRFVEVRQGLHYAMKNLGPVTPMPRDDTWYKTVFQNFDTQRAGYLSYEQFCEIIRQNYEHHWKRYQKSTNTESAYPRQEPAVSSPTRAALGAGALYRDRQTALIQKPRPSVSPQRTNSGDIGKVTLASYIWCPKHRGVQKIFEDYTTYENDVLGAGTYGKVFPVRHKRTGELRACKRISLMETPVCLIEQEIQLMKSLDHPNILRLHESYHDGQLMYLLMELCLGGMLFDRITKKEQYPITELQVAEWIQQILSATAYCHGRGIIHRDIKPENIVFVSPDPGSPLKVIDFGLSSTMDKIQKREVNEPKTGVGAWVARVLPKINGKTIVQPSVKRAKMDKAGTAHYMAPEMIKRDYDVKCDVFSVGVIMYQLLSGIHPFYSKYDGEEQIRNKILNENPSTDHPPAIWSPISSDAKKLLRSLLEKDPKKRVSAEDALKHPWFNCVGIAEITASQPLGSVFEGLKNWQNQNKFKQAVLQLLAKTLSEGDIAQLRDKFMMLDKKRDGSITLDELRLSMQQSGYVVVESELKKICDSFDTRDGVIGYTEFLGALMAYRWNVEEAELREVFQKFDTSSSGFITLANLKDALKNPRYGQLTPDEISKIFEEIDKNNDGKVDFSEFLMLMAN